MATAECLQHGVIVERIRVLAGTVDDHEKRIRALQADRMLMTAEVSRSAARYSLFGSVIGAAIAGLVALGVAWLSRGGA